MISYMRRVKMEQGLRSDIDREKLKRIINIVYFTELGEAKKNTPDKKIVNMHMNIIKEKVNAYKED